MNNQENKLKEKNQSKMSNKDDQNLSIPPSSTQLGTKTAEGLLYGASAPTDIILINPTKFFNEIKVKVTLYVQYEVIPEFTMYGSDSEITGKEGSNPYYEFFVAFDSSKATSSDAFYKYVFDITTSADLGIDSASYLLPILWDLFIPKLHPTIHPEITRGTETAVQGG
jgi:hypothetical protein